MSGEDALPFLAIYSFRLIEVFGYLFLYIWINNCFAEDKNKANQRLLLIPIIIYLISGVLSSGRMYILQYSGGAVMCFYILWHRKYGWNKFIGFKFIGWIIFAFVGVLLIFTAMRRIVGRGIEFDPLYYITLYGGQSIACLELFLKDMPPKSNIWGKETFNGIINFIGKVSGNNNFRYVSHKEFRYSNGILLGNVYTAFRRYYYDFGYWGVAILTAIASFFGIFYFSIDDRLFGNIITVGTVIWIFLMYCAGIFLTINIKIKR